MDRDPASTPAAESPNPSPGKARGKKKKSFWESPYVLAMAVLLIILTVFHIGVYPSPFSAVYDWFVIRYHERHMDDFYREHKDGWKWRDYNTHEDYNVDATRLEPVRLDRPASLAFATAEAVPRMDGGTAFFPLYEGVMHAVAPEPKDEVIKQRLQYSTSRGAFTGLADAKVDILFALEPSEEQRRQLEEAILEVRLKPLGREAFVFFVRRDNPVDGLTLDQARGIYAGTIVNWNEVGGPDRPIRAFQRARNSGSQTTMIAAVMGDTPIITPPARIVSSMGLIMGEVLNYDNEPDAIGYSFLHYVTYMNPSPDVKILAIDGVRPSHATIRDQTYPLVRPFYAVTTPLAGPGTEEVLAWLDTEEGRELIRRAGMCPKSGNPKREAGLALDVSGRFRYK